MPQKWVRLYRGVPLSLLLYLSPPISRSSYTPICHYAILIRFDHALNGTCAAKCIPKATSHNRMIHLSHICYNNPKAQRRVFTLSINPSGSPPNIPSGIYTPYSTVRPSSPLVTRVWPWKHTSEFTTFFSSFFFIGAPPIRCTSNTTHQLHFF